MRIGADAALFLGEESTARRYAETFFIRNYSVDDGGLLNRAGVQITPDLLRSKGEYLLVHSAFDSAFEAFTKAGDANGVKRTLDRMAVAPRSE